jgi:hypothetical protein
MNRIHLVIPFCFLFAACSETVGSTSSKDPPPTDPGVVFEVPVPASGKTYVSLEKPAIVQPAGDASMDLGWDLAFEGYDVFTNSGISGFGDGGAFGPLDASVYDEGTAPTLPFVTKDQAGGPFRDYWAYDPMVHQLWVRYHVYGVREGSKYWKVQVMGYYAEVQGAPVAAIYRLRWAEVTSSGAGPTQVLSDLDGTAGGSQPKDDVPSECLDLGTGARVFHTPASARNAKDWHLCFRRSVISVNGELGGPRGITAVDLHAQESANETLDQVKTRTDASELARFDAVGFSDLTAPNLVWRGDRVISAFSDYWVDPAAKPQAPAKHTWLTSSADAQKRWLVVFDRFEGATEMGPGKVILRIRPEGIDSSEQ